MPTKKLSNSFHPCPKPDRKQKRKSKIAKLEKERYSILTTNLEKCYLCDREKDHMHEIYKGSNRQVSMKNGFCIPICCFCHIQTEIDSKLDKELKIKCQKEFEKTHSREEFIKIIGKSYI